MIMSETLDANKTKKKRIIYLDYLRALAIIAVILFHIFKRVGFMAVPGYSIMPSFSWWIPMPSVRMCCQASGPRRTKCGWKPSSAWLADRRSFQTKNFLQKIRRIIRRISVATMKWEMRTGSAEIPSVIIYPLITWCRN